MPETDSTPLASAPSNGTVQAQLARVLASPIFASAERSRKFLEFVVRETLAGRAEDIKESLVAVVVFRKEASFDPRADSIVRVEARNLRSRLREYYATEGREDPVLIEVPKGSYVPQFQRLTPAAGGPPPSSPRSRVWWLLAAALAVAVALAVHWGIRRMRPARINSIAVLPFLNLGEGSENSYICDGLVDDLTAYLARNPALRVAARTSAFQFRGRAEDVRRIGQQLGVGAVIEGSVTRRQGTVKVTVQMIDTANGYHLWSETYHRPDSQMFALTEEVSRSAMKALGFTSSSAAAPGRTSAEARDLYWRGRYARGLGVNGPAQSVTFFERAVRADPGFADAHAALATTWVSMAFVGDGQVAAEYYAKARGAARRAIELDPANAEAQAVLGTASFYGERDFARAEAQMLRSIELNPSRAWTRKGYALMLVTQGRFDDALAQFDRAREVDPLSLVSGNDVAVAYYCARRFDHATRAARRTLEVNPKFFPGPLMLGSCLAAQGRFREAIQEFERAIALSSRDASILGRMGYAMAASGDTAGARAILREMETAKSKSYVQMSFVQAGLGDKPAALDSMGRAAERQETDLFFMAVEPLWDSLHAEPRFRALAAYMGVPLR